MHTTMNPEPIRLTYADYCALPEDGRRYEILDGDLDMSPAPLTTPQRVSRNLSNVLVDEVHAKGLGEILTAPYDVVLGEHCVVQPDIIFVANENARIITPKNIQGSPDLLIEVLSPTSIERDTRDKRNIYARCGVKHYWMVDPAARTVTELALVEKAYAVVKVTGGQEAFRPALFPGLDVPPSELWE